jgi:hypothetical protein
MDFSKCSIWLFLALLYYIFIFVKYSARLVPGFGPIIQLTLNSAMTIILIALTAIIVLAVTIFSLYTSVNSGASKFGQWIEKIFNEEKD